MACLLAWLDGMIPVPALRPVPVGGPEWSGSTRDALTRLLAPVAFAGRASAFDGAEDAPGVTDDEISSALDDIDLDFSDLAPAPEPEPASAELAAEPSPPGGDEPIGDEGTGDAPGPSDPMRSADPADDAGVPGDAARASTAPDAGPAPDPIPALAEAATPEPTEMGEPEEGGTESPPSEPAPAENATPAPGESPPPEPPTDAPAPSVAAALGALAAAAGGPASPPASPAGAGTTASGEPAAETPAAVAPDAGAPLFGDPETATDDEHPAIATDEEAKDAEAAGYGRDGDPATPVAAPSPVASRETPAEVPVVLELVPPRRRWGLKGSVRLARWMILHGTDRLLRRAGRDPGVRPRPVLPPELDAIQVRASERLVLVPPGGRHGRLFRLLTGLERAGRGQMTLMEAPLHGLGEVGRARARRRSVGAVSADVPLVPSLTVAENVALPAQLDAGDDPEPLDAVLDVCGLTEIAGAYPHQLEIEDELRTLVARSLIRRPPLVLVDAQSFDEATHAALMPILAELVPKHATLVLIDHDEEPPEWVERTVTIHRSMVA